jgi:hypothetical protein
MRIALRRVDLLARERRILRIDPDLIQIPQDDLVACITRDIGHVKRQLRMPIVREHDNAPQLTVDHAAFLDVAGKHRELLTITAPVDRK